MSQGPAGIGVPHTVPLLDPFQESQSFPGWLLGGSGPGVGSPELTAPLRFRVLSPAPLQDSSPGPVYFLDPRVTRFGRSCPPAYSMQGRGKIRGEYNVCGGKWPFTVWEAVLFMHDWSSKLECSQRYNLSFRKAHYSSPTALSWGDNTW